MLIASLKKINEKNLLKANQADFVELREDIFGLKGIVGVKKFLKPSIILKLKKRESIEGILKELKKIDPDFVDLESDFNPKIADDIRKNFKDVKIILSHHDFEKTPKNLKKFFLEEMQNFKADIYKMACFANSSLDALRMLLFMRGRKNFFGMCMGEKGRITRILAPIFKGVSYCNLEGEGFWGQMEMGVLEKRYRYKNLNERTEVYALIGDPLDKSPSHIIHNKIFSVLKRDALYVKIPLKKEELLEFFEIIKKLPFKGFSVTMPLKEEVLKFIKVGDKKVLSVNTVVRKGDELIGFNTDGIGALRAIEKRVSLRGKKILVLGAGGASKGICLELKKRGAIVVILNRDEKKAKALAKKLEGEFGGFKDLEEFLEKKIDILINTTPIFLGENVLKKILLKKIFFMDININSKNISFLRKKGFSKVIDGFEMFLFQAKEQFGIWLKKDVKTLKAQA
jgi:3-dehydroquinate dehydratase/shikimate dehydrogenase